MSLLEKPFFIVGNPRSGTTLLRFILSSHPRLYVPGETGFIPSLSQYAQRRLSLAQVSDLLQRVGRLNGAWHNLVSDVDAFYQSLPEPDLRHILDALYRQKIEPQGAVRWGDKTPSYVLHVSLLAEIFSTAQFIHLIRDGRDAALSAQKKWGGQRWYMDTYYLLASWNQHVKKGREAGQKLGRERYLEVRYEDLVRRPWAVTEEICQFLQETSSPQMLDHTRLAQEQIGPKGHVEVRQPVSTTSVQRWKGQMSSFDQKLADRLVGATLSELGYELAQAGSFSAIERLKLCFLFGKYRCVNLARTLLYSSGLLTLNRGKRRKR